MENAERLAAELTRGQQQPESGAAEISDPAAPEIGSGPAAEPEIPKKVLGPRRTKIARAVPEPSDTYRRPVLGPRRSKLSRPQEASP
jgi:hypothetical protein